MNYVCFGHTSRDVFPYDKLLRLLPDGGELLYIIDFHHADDSRNVGAVHSTLLDDLDANQTVAFVTHPYWVQEVIRFSPKYTVAIITPPPTQEGSILWEKCWSFLSARATIVCTESEKVYLEQCFRRNAVFLISGEDLSSYDLCKWKGETLFLRDYEVLFRDAIGRMIRDHSLEDLVERQWSIRRTYYQKLMEQVGVHETVHFLLAVYSYLLQEEDAPTYLLQSFEQSLLAGNKACLKTHYRFLSAMEAKAGNLPRAVTIYGNTALLPDEKKHYLSLLALLEQGEENLVKAEIFRLNEDYKSAVEVLIRSFSDRARRTLFQVYLQAGNMENALQTIKPSDLASASDFQNYTLLAGTVRAMFGERHEAIHLFLKAATYDHEAIQYILELSNLDEALDKLKGGDRIGSEADSQIEG